MQYGRSKVIDENVRFLGVLAKNELLSHVYVHIFWTVKDMEKLIRYVGLKIWLALKWVVTR